MISPIKTKTPLLISILIVLALPAIYLYLTRGSIYLKDIRTYNNLSVEDLEKGVQCQTILTSYIGNGVNSDTLEDLHGSIKRVDNNDSHSFTLTLKDNLLIQKNEFNNIEYKIIDNNGPTYKATVKGGQIYMVFNKHYGEFRRTGFNHFEGDGIQSSRGTCTKQDLENQ